MDKQEACGGVAQSVEQRTENPRVDGSIPPPATRFDVKSNRSCQRRQDSFDNYLVPQSSFSHGGFPDPQKRQTFFLD